MKLYLSSYRIPNSSELFELLDKKPNDVKVAVIPNAKDYYSDYVKNLKNADLLTYLEALGLTNCETVDLNEYTSLRKSALQEKLHEFDLIWVNGGNTFCLRYAMRKSGFDQIIREVVDAGVVYGGESAGAIVAGNTIKGAELADEPTFAKEQIYEGLRLANAYIIPHTDSPEWADTMAQIQSDYDGLDQVIALKDSQAYLVNDDDKRVVSTD